MLCNHSFWVIFSPASFLVTSQPKRIGFNQYRLTFFTRIISSFAELGRSFQHIVGIKTHCFHAISRPLLFKGIKNKLLVLRCTETPIISLYNKNYRQIPYCSNIKCFMKISLRGRSIPSKCKHTFACVL